MFWKKREKKVFYNVCYSNSWDRKGATEWVTNDNREMLKVHPPQRKVMSLSLQLIWKNKTDLRSVSRLKSSSQLQVIIMAFYRRHLNLTLLKEKQPVVLWQILNSCMDGKKNRKKVTDTANTYLCFWGVGGGESAQLKDVETLLSDPRRWLLRSSGATKQKNE